MAQCPNCKNPMGCSCQQRRASDGKVCCSSCINTHEEHLKRIKEQQKQSVQANLRR